jgi:galactoside O-acetyltransferase
MDKTISKNSTQKERMDAGLVYLSEDESVVTEQFKRMEMLYDYNKTRPKHKKRRAKILKKMFHSIGEDAYIEPPLHANWTGKFVTIGKHFYSNYNLTLVDDGPIEIGDNVMCAPNVVIATAGHPINPFLRTLGGQYNAGVKIGNNVWLGASVTVMPGVTIGDNSVIGAGSVVTKDIPANVVAFGNPCKVQREIGEKDNREFFKGMLIDWENLPNPEKQ